MTHYRFIVLIAIILHSTLSAQIRQEYKYLFSAHTYMGENIIDSRLVELDKSVYDNIWLGGDICSETLMNPSTVEYLQEHLKIQEPHNYFCFGNHDRRNGNLDTFISFTGKNSYYADNFNNITCIVLDTNLAPDDCENLNNQYNIICNVTDTIQQSSHLILLFHWGLWGGIPGLPSPATYCHSNLIYWNSNCDSTNNNFAQIIYPKLVEVKNRGVEVICIMGDMGATYKKIDFRSDDDIIFLGCGLENIKHRWEEDQWWTYEKDLILELDHNIDNGEITWTYRDIDSLLFVQNGYTYLQKLTFDDFENYPADNIVFFQREDYQYKLGLTDSLTVLDTAISQETLINNDFTLTSVFKSETTTNEIEVVFRLIEDDAIIEEQISTINSIPLNLKYYQLPFSFDSNLENGHSIQVIVRNTSNSAVLMNNLTIMFE
ncbi:MAG: hypothetical protein JXR36_16970 [Bacteroidales bacterium]|nr:hypothetical protein [Bacteroidales bacterium]